MWMTRFSKRRHLQSGVVIKSGGTIHMTAAYINKCRLRSHPRPGRPVLPLLFKRIMHGGHNALAFQSDNAHCKSNLETTKTADLFRKRRAQSSNHTCSEIIHAQPQRQTAERKSKAQSTTIKGIQGVGAATCNDIKGPAASCSAARRAENLETLHMVAAPSSHHWSSSPGNDTPENV
jgi:hypothetical protein